MRYNEIIKIPSILIKKGEVPEGAKYTIAIPTYKRANLLKEAIDSCLAQKTSIPFVIMVVDNNPERNCETEQLIQSYKVSNLLYYKNTKNIGASGNWNKLFHLAITDYVVMLHDDDLLYNDYIEKIDRIICLYKGSVEVIYPAIEIFTQNKNSFERQRKGAIRAMRLHSYDFQFGNTCDIVGVCFSRKSIIEENGFDAPFITIDGDSKNKNFYIPGSSFRGYLSTKLERFLDSGNGFKIKNNGEELNEADVKLIFGYTNLDKLETKINDKDNEEDRKWKERKDFRYRGIEKRILFFIG
mgnify:CR=1 FL=1